MFTTVAVTRATAKMKFLIERFSGKAPQARAAIACAVGIRTGIAVGQAGTAIAGPVGIAARIAVGPSRIVLGLCATRHDRGGACHRGSTCNARQE